MTVELIPIKTPLLSKYYKIESRKLEDIPTDEIGKYYENGYVLTRLDEMQQTRSLRIDLDQFDVNSENRRILRKSEYLRLKPSSLPLQENETNWQIQALAKTFYSQKFEDVTFSASRIRRMIKQGDNLKDQRFNTLLAFFDENYNMNAGVDDYTKALGFCICYKDAQILHYCYPFYRINSDNSPLREYLGIAMMLKSILWAKGQNLEFVYLGSATRPTDRYKLQFPGLEWWTGKTWSQSLGELKEMIVG